MTLLQDLKNVADGLFIHRKEAVKTQMSRSERQRKAKQTRMKQLENAYSSTGDYHKESLLKKWGYFK